MEENEFIVLDRWKASSWTYRLASGVSMPLVGKLCSLLVEPDYTIILNGHANAVEMRDAYEKDEELQRKVRWFYEAYHDENIETSVQINANQSRDVISKYVVSRLEEVGIMPFDA